MAKYSLRILYSLDYSIFLKISYKVKIYNINNYFISSSKKTKTPKRLFVVHFCIQVV